MNEKYLVVETTKFGKRGVNTSIPVANENSTNVWSTYEEAEAMIEVAIEAEKAYWTTQLQKNKGKRIENIDEQFKIGENFLYIEEYDVLTEYEIFELKQYNPMVNGRFACFKRVTDKNRNRISYRLVEKNGVNYFETKRDLDIAIAGELQSDRDVFQETFEIDDKKFAKLVRECNVIVNSMNFVAKDFDRIVEYEEFFLMEVK